MTLKNRPGHFQRFPTAFLTSRSGAALNNYSQRKIIDTGVVALARRTLLPRSSLESLHPARSPSTRNSSPPQARMIELPPRRRPPGAPFPRSPRFLQETMNGTTAPRSLPPLGRTRQSGVSTVSPPAVDSGTTPLWILRASGERHRGCAASWSTSRTAPNGSRRAELMKPSRSPNPDAASTASVKALNTSRRGRRATPRPDDARSSRHVKAIRRNSCLAPLGWILASTVPRLREGCRTARCTPPARPPRLAYHIVAT